MLLESPRPIPVDLEQRLEALRERLVESEGFDALVLFGSLARGDAHVWSDADVGVLTRRRLGFAERASLTAAMEGALGRPVDLVDLERAPLALQGRAARDAISILVNDPAAWRRFLIRATTRWLDYRPLYERAVRLAVRRLAREVS